LDRSNERNIEEVSVNRKSKKNWVSAITFAAVAGSSIFALAQKPATYPSADVRTLTEWCGEAGEKAQWELFEHCAGKPSRGLVVVARPIRDTFEVGKALELDVSIQNVSNETIRFSQGRVDTPLAMARDEAGNPVPRTDEGRRAYSWLAYAIQNKRIRELKPGCARGADFNLDRYYAVKSPGVYTLLVSELVMGGCIAKPVTIRIVEPGTLRLNAGIKEAVPDFGPEKPSDKDWSGLAAVAGRPLEGLVLDACRSPVKPDFVIVSIRRGDDDRTKQVPAPNAASIPAQYWVLIRGPSGRPLPMVDRAIPRNDASGHRDSLDWRNVALSRGDAIGATIPVTRLFDMKRSGEYTILVALPSSQRKAPAWVAAPLKFRVGNANGPIEAMT
jgi:hypothetical protein